MMIWQILLWVWQAIWSLFRSKMLQAIILKKNAHGRFLGNFARPPDQGGHSGLRWSAVTWDVRQVYLKF